LLIFGACFVAGFRPVSLTAIPFAFLFMALIAIVFAALGTAIGSSLKDMQGFQLVMNFLVMPIFFLSGAIYPLSMVPRTLQIVASIDPLAYGVDGLRAALIDQAHFGVPLDLAVLSTITLGLLLLGARLFNRIEL
jgi:ABC-2 type transport system permease protein